MKKTLGYLKPYKATVASALTIKFIGSVSELFLPFLLEYIVNTAVPAKSRSAIFIAGALMLVCAFGALSGNIITVFR